MPLKLIFEEVLVEILPRKLLNPVILSWCIQMNTVTRYMLFMYYHWCYLCITDVIYVILMQIFLAVTGLWCSGKVSLLALKKNFSNVVVTSRSSCVFLYLFSNANILLVRFVLHLQDWWCIGKRATSFPVNKLWLIYFPSSLWPLTMKNRYACKF